MRKMSATIIGDTVVRSVGKTVLNTTDVAVFAFIFISCASPGPATEQRTAQSDDSRIARAFASRASDIQVEGEGTVIRILPDDLDRPRHQRFIVQLASRQTLLITHNIDIPRIDGLEVGDSVRFNGEYVWNEKGHDYAAQSAHNHDSKVEFAIVQLYL
jgi:hypothetical protein